LFKLLANQCPWATRCLFSCRWKNG